jgi:hypothetical protein
MGLYSLESSAGNAILEPCPTYSGMSLMYTRHRRGPKMDPCGTPEVTGSQSEWVPEMNGRSKINLLARRWILSVRLIMQFR